MTDVSVGVCLTVADSKRAFHSAFPHVIAPIYRRLVDELLVELHLLSHQKGFQPDGLFAVGLTQVFDSFSKGYRPEEQREPLFMALCSSTGFDGDALRAKAEQARVDIKSPFAPARLFDHDRDHRHKGLSSWADPTEVWPGSALFAS